MSDLLLSVDEYERKALERRRDVDAEQARETELRLGTAPDAVDTPPEPSARGSLPAPDAGIGPSTFDLPAPRSYDDVDDD